MLAVKFGGRVYGPGVFMYEEDASMVKHELIMRGTETSKKLAQEIIMPSDGIVHSGETHFGYISPKGGR